MNAISRPQCLEGTRERILQNRLDTPSAAAKILWLCGTAGCGKSTIARPLLTSLKLRLGHVPRPKLMSFSHGRTDKSLVLT
ncbi:hypothetical protein FIBSPDRAFT_261708 [Athelia psychrophila]|uniref:Nephrocystin 3-like N-terminal domain-containing protein n=1 Tax=Athelia psychrophila TaxID=1759441 RepID=A0A165XH04_9AGAM|nr:hypothetical protein FIBSPDRAFT_261708 [Fibularhizoctonia sp. CBS 109695]